MARMGTGIALAVGAAAGAAAQYFLDRDGGRRRRHVARDRGLAVARRQAREAARSADYAAGKAKGAVSSAMPSPSDDRKLEQLGDPALARKVESEVFRGEDLPKGSISVNAEYGVIYLRGEVPSRELMDELTVRARGVDGVRAVENLTHLPGEPAKTA
jgi:osmotically-inducible protein OsmY